jgi:hypothetical protein
VLRLQLVSALGDKPLSAITTEDLQQLKSALSARSPKTVNNVFAVLHELMRTAVEWNVTERVQCSIKMHQDLGTTQRYMHLSPAALDAAIRLLDGQAETGGGIVEASRTRG